MDVDTPELLLLLADCFAAMRGGTREIGGSILFRVEGCEGLRVDLDVPGGAWEVELDDDGRAHHATIITLTHAALEALLFAPHEVPGFIAAGALHATGSPQRLARIGARMGAVGRVLSARARRLATADASAGTSPESCGLRIN